MNQVHIASEKIMDLKHLSAWVAAQRVKGKKIAFTNGCFDIIHIGHIASLQAAAKEADFLIVAINSDSSVKRLKGPQRPVNFEMNRALVISSFIYTDAVIIFEEDTPLRVIKSILPDVLVKGGDYTIDKIVGASDVIANGGRVVINPIVDGYSTTGTLQKVQDIK